MYTIYQNRLFKIYILTVFFPYLGGVLDVAGENHFALEVFLKSFPEFLLENSYF